MDKGKFIERLMATFLVELGEHVRALNEELLALEKDPAGAGRAERLKVLLRAAHSLKGAARSVGVGLIEEACHRLESILTALRDGPLTFSPDLFALLFATADALEEAGMRLREQQDLSDSPLAALLPRLEEAAGGTVPAPVPVAPRLAAQVPLPSRPVAGPPAAKPPDVPRAAAPPPPHQDAERVPGVVAFVRVPAEKLDAMLTRSGELLVARRRIESRIEELAALREEWTGLVKPLRKHVSLEPSAGIASRFGDQLDRIEEDFERLSLAINGDRRQLARAAGLLDEEVRRVRMLPIAEACQGLERIVRDVARPAGKQVALVIEGGMSSSTAPCWKG